MWYFSLLYILRGKKAPTLLVKIFDSPSKNHAPLLLFQFLFTCACLLAAHSVSGAGSSCGALRCQCLLFSRSRCFGVSWFGVRAWGRPRNPVLTLQGVWPEFPLSLGDTKACVPSGKVVMGSPEHTLLFCLNG